MSCRSSNLMSSRFKLSRTLFNARSVLNKCKSLMRMFQSLRICDNHLTRIHALSLVPCGHTSCLTCLQCWFRAPPRSVQEGEPDIPVSRRKKTCPQCRSVVTQRPVGVFLIRDFAHHVETMLSVHEGRPPAVAQQESNAGVDPWEGIFPAFGNRTADGAIVDNEDGGVRRCPHCTWEILGGVCEGCGREFDDSDGEFDDDDEQFFMPPIDDYFFPPFPLAWYAGIDDYDDDEYDTPAEYDMDDYEGSFISDGEQDAGSREWVFDLLYLEDVLNSTCSSTPAFETYVDAQSEHSHSPSQRSDYSGNSNQYRRQSVELVDGPSNLGLNTEAEDWINPSDSEDGREVFLRAPHGNRQQVIFSDDEDEHLADVSLWSLSSQNTGLLMIIHRGMMKTLTMDPIDACAPRQSPFVIALVHQVRALNFEFSRDELSQTSLMIQLYTSVSTEVYPHTLSTCATCCLIAPQ